MLEERLNEICASANAQLRPFLLLDLGDFLRDIDADQLKPQQRLHQRYRKLLAKGKNKGVVVTAIGRELLGFIWAIGTKVETMQKESLQRAA
jgi:hypothetical protein